MDKIIRSQRSYFLDILRILACMMVILMHSPSIYHSGTANPFFLSGISYLTQPCIGLFFMVSGALLLPTTLSTKEFLKRRLGRVICPTILWSIVYITLNQMVSGGGYSASLKSLLSIPFSAQGNGVLWFMYTLIGFYLIIPIISPWLLRANKGEVKFYIILFLVSTIYPFLSDYLNLDRGTGNILYYFASYGGYFLLGLYFYNNQNSIKLKYLTLAYLLVLFLPVLFLICGQRESFWAMMSYLSLPVVIMATFWFKLIQQLQAKIDRWNQQIKSLIAKLSSLSFGVYLIHIAVMRYFLWNQDIIVQIPSHILQTFVIFILTTIISTILVWLISKLPVSKYIIGS